MTEFHGLHRPRKTVSPRQRKISGLEHFRLIGNAGQIVVGIRNDKIREGAVRWKAALKSGGENVEISFEGFLFVCSADKLTTTIDVLNSPTSLQCYVRQC
jgi:hypothetical protein